MATVSMTKGAELAGVSKGTVSKALKSGRLSYAEKTDNGYLIDTSELFRVFPPKQTETVETARFDTPLGNRETLMETGGLLREVELLREQLRDRDGVVDDLRQRLDKSEDERREAQARVIGLLAGPGPTESKRGFFGRLFGRRAALTPHQQTEALQRLAAGDTQRTVAALFDVDQATISRLARR
jgi:transcriptional regulator with XRE-family HTH domain